ncbi:ABC transporter permease subunit [Vibrio sp. SS-MA-C1-2]|uniref:ABC transporter permease n=1 Tax=Vibrio sp. SS-MA-C1-2 TaxID=2908646 RepID=UPI001F1A1974|nr:ABC transporter permease subunit [Vibrio sp. SS-MA-C1-2]UJF18255.1 ABC transporter permease subunit [Vibrio sp. SS-MA-C1-2]
MQTTSMKILSSTLFIILILVITPFFSGGALIFYHYSAANEWVMSQSVQHSLLAIKQFLASDLSVLLHHSYYSIVLLFSGLLCSVVVAVLLLWLTSLSRRCDKVILPVVIMGQAIPSVALAPIIISYFGLGFVPKILFVATFSFFPIFFYANSFLKSQPKEWQKFHLLLGLNKNQRFWRIDLWHALPSLATGLRLSLTYSFGTVIFVEWLGGKYGLGIYLARALSSFSSLRVTIIACYVTLMALLLVKFARWCEKRIIYWQ